jgi:hypothetical protein
MTVIKVVRHADSMMYCTQTEINRFVGSNPDVMQHVRRYCRNISNTPGHQKKPGRNIFFQVLSYNERLRTWEHMETWINGYQEY